ncbi:undecaprenyl pyrophosphate phosphatase [Pseudobythopirellula maris]|uniref:Undecaprenyl pyrophosphate phosphatase n=1 Tax=Pseudobythopirellula maris TaxID=2527991 RepID=A0A5C5ZTK0_9BACT|nr:phosphatase PAP2 family protein [Pseudobythopirellula maris]TWT90874.1 undecaprenyl pyrophosphate phosphatase [Pseudobythopirellula maris]
MAISKTTLAARRRLKPGVLVGLPWRTTCVLLAAALGLALAADVRVAEAFHGWDPPGEVGNLLQVAEVFGNGFGVMLIVGVIAVMDPSNRYRSGRILTCGLGAGVMADVVKLLVARSRPRSIDFAAAPDLGLNDTFLGLMPMLSHDSNIQSFPSAHTASAFGLATALVLLYPHARGLFVALAVAVGMQRVFVGAHFPSDTVIGAVVGVLSARHCLGATRLGRFFGWAERKYLRFYGIDPAERADALAEPPEATEPARRCAA